MLFISSDFNQNQDNKFMKFFHTEISSGEA
jgi:hypothetical protein